MSQPKSLAWIVCPNVTAQVCGMECVSQCHSPSLWQGLCVPMSQPKSLALIVHPNVTAQVCGMDCVSQCHSPSLWHRLCVPMSQPKSLAWIVCPNVTAQVFGMDCVSQCHSPSLWHGLCVPMSQPKSLHAVQLCGPHGSVGPNTWDEVAFPRPEATLVAPQDWRAGKKTFVKTFSNALFICMPLMHPIIGIDSQPLILS